MKIEGVEEKVQGKIGDIERKKLIFDLLSIQCLMLVNTGAIVTLLRTWHKNFPLKTATGEKTEIRGKLDAFIELDLEKNKIRSGGEEIPLSSASVQHSKSCSVLAKKRFIIPARSEYLIQGVPEVPGEYRYSVTDFPSQACQKGVLVAATLFDLEMAAIPVRVLNLNNKPKILDKGAVIATCEPVLDIVDRPEEFSEAQHIQPTLENFQILNEEQRTEIRKLLKEFQNLFSTCDADVGRCNMTQHRVNKCHHPPIKKYQDVCLLQGKKKQIIQLKKWLTMG
ncbi:hypothetical protein AVEN_94763-1 [Araneus ventricosus]|uniref:Peptidase A9 domain-containing protein n=1 Tax=Araneus ventricosus TaxID=182803 RepID=A0A4Y2CMS5_ARAVE|nr:hypothetical protein AVEN_94763-1 [Araneus ventricosus]